MVKPYVAVGVALVCWACTACGDDGGGGLAPTQGQDSSEASVLVLPSLGATWDIDIDSANWTAPENVAEAVAAFPTTYPFYIGVTGTEGAAVDLMLALAAEAGGQDMCSRTVEMLEVSVSDDHRLVREPADFLMANGIVTHDLSLEARLNEDMTEIESMALSGTIVLSTIPPDVLPLGDGENSCELLGLLDIACEPCRDGSVDCVTVTVEDIKASPAAGTALSPVDLADCHVDCAASDDNEACDL